jgi:hypothetical protein
MSVQLYQLVDDVYLTGAGATPCLRWHRQDGSWLSEPAELPESATKLHIDQVPEDLREELMAFVVRADAMGGNTQQFGN